MIGKRSRYLFAAGALALAACMKAGDGVGVDATGKQIPFCVAFPDDPSCKVDPCAADSAAPACVAVLCQLDPARPGCQLPPDCAANPSDPRCAVDSCAANPSLPGCQPKTRFAEVFTIIQANSCLTCHVPGGLGVTQGKLNLQTADSAYANLVGAPVTFPTMAPGWFRVVPGKPDSSILVLKLEAPTPNVLLPNKRPYNGRMPLNLGPISSDDMALVRKWIQDGAQK